MDRGKINSTEDMELEYVQAVSKNSPPNWKFTKEINLVQVEKDVLAFWNRIKAFSLLQQKNSTSKKIYSFIDGPITANNPMGVHHAWGRTLKDVYQRYHGMLGKKQRFQNGFDCQGLWVEVEVEKALNLNSKKEILDYGLEEFSQACKDRVNRYATVITQQSKRLGQWMDWQNSYFTMDDYNIEHIWTFLKECFHRGWLYRGQKVMPWCFRCGTSLSAHEMADSYKQLTHTSIYLRLPVKDEENTYFLLWTTTPWTLPANTALAVHPDLIYLLVEHNNSRYYIAEGAIDKLKGTYRIIKQLEGRDLLLKDFTGPFEELTAQKSVKTRKVIPWNEISQQEGTGIVHIAPGCGLEDYELGKQYQLAVVAPIDEEGKFIAEFDYLAQLSTKEANQIIFDTLRQKNFFYQLENYTHRYPVCWRCKTELVFKLESEWFIDCDVIRPKMKEVAKNIEWQPEHIGELMQNWLSNMDDWCISRKRYWGLPLPFYKCDECNEVTVIGTRAELKQYATNPNNVESLSELHRPWIDEIKISCPVCGTQTDRIEEVGDCWLDAGIVPFSTLNYLNDKTYWKQWFPAELIIEMKEQVRLWFYSMLFMSVTLIGKVPYKRVIAYEEVRDAKGERMSKTGDNNVVFDDAVEELGADVMRWMYVDANLKSKLHFSNKSAAEIKRELLNYWNIVYFLLSSAQADKFTNADLKQFTRISKQKPIDSWLYAELEHTKQTICSYYTNHSHRNVLKEAKKFLDLLSNWYVRLNRDRYWKSEHDIDKQEAYGTLYAVILEFSRLMAPILPFFTEYVYQLLVPVDEYKLQPSVHLTDFPTRNKECALPTEKLRSEFKVVQNVISMALKLRSMQKLRLRQPLSELKVITANKRDKHTLHKFKDLIIKATNVKKFNTTENLAESMEYQITPNYSVLGPKFRGKLKYIEQELETFSQEKLERLFQKQVPLLIKRAGEAFELYPEDYHIKIKDKEGHVSILNSGIRVSLDFSITAKLKAEGFARDIVRHLQQLRKDLGLHITDGIETALNFQKSDKKLLDLISHHQKYIKDETLSKRLQYDAELEKPDIKRSIELGDLLKVELQIAKE